MRLLTHRQTDRHTDRQTDRQTEAKTYPPSFGGGNELNANKVSPI